MFGLLLFETLEIIVLFQNSFFGMQASRKEGSLVVQRVKFRATVAVLEFYSPDLR